MKLVLSLLLLTSLASASSVTYDTGVFQSGSLKGSSSNGGTVDAQITGSLASIDISTGTLTQFTTNCPVGSMCFSFSSGSVSVGNGGSIFKDSLVGGLTIKNNGAGSITATLVDTSKILSGDATATFDFSGMKITGGSEDVAVQIATVPEPSTLLFLGTGLVPLAGFLKYRAKKLL